ARRGARLRRAGAVRGQGRRSPVERALPPDVDVGDEEDEDEEGELREAEPAERVELDGERVEEDDLDVEDDEEHRRQVEAHAEALARQRPRRDARLERHGPSTGAARGPLRELERHPHHRARNDEREDAVDQEWQPAVEHLLPPLLTQRRLTLSTS